MPQLVCMTELKNLKKCIKWKFSYQSLSPVLRALKIQWNVSEIPNDCLGLIKKRELSFKLDVYYRSPGNEFVL